MRDELSEVLGEFDHVPHPTEHGDIKLFDFGDGILAAPIMRGDSYSTTRVCYLYLQGKGTLEQQTLSNGKVLDFGDGWLFYGVEMPIGMSQMDLRDKLEEGAKKLEVARGR